MVSILVEWAVSEPDSDNAYKHLHSPYNDVFVNFDPDIQHDGNHFKLTIRHHHFRHTGRLDLWIQIDIL